MHRSADAKSSPRLHPYVSNIAILSNLSIPKCTSAPRTPRRAGMRFFACFAPPRVLGEDSPPCKVRRQIACKLVGACAEATHCAAPL